MAAGFLKSVYDLDGEDAVRDYYDDWAASYDAEIAQNGYATPRRCAEALAASGLAKDAPILDMGCGTGLSGLALRAQGFTVIDGCDLSPGMLARAGKRGVYRALHLSGDLPGGGYAAVAAVGVIGPGAAPPELFDTCLGLIDPGGRFVFSFNDHALEDPAYPARLADALAADQVRLLFEERGDHLPGIAVKSVVYVLEKK